MQKKLKEGDKFGRVRFDHQEYKHHVWFDDDGIENSGYRTFYHFTCDCGNTFSVMYLEWKGQRSTPDCGKCGLADRSEGRVNLIVAVRPDTAAKAKGTARAKGMMFSQWLRDCIQAGIDGRIVK